MVVTTATTPADPRLTPLPVNTVDIKNDHFEYAVTWFLLAFVWAVMTLFLIIRTTRPKDA
jgi:surfeit locus 1 family protein